MTGQQISTRLGIARSPALDERFFDALRQGRTISIAARWAGYEPDNVVCWRRMDRIFDLAIRGAQVEGTDYLTEIARQRGFEGVEVVKVVEGGGEDGNGRVVTTERRASDALAMFLLKARDPSFARPAAVEVSGPNRGPIETTTEVNVNVNTGDRAKAVLAILAGADPSELSTILGG